MASPSPTGCVPRPRPRSPRICRLALPHRAAPPTPPPQVEEVLHKGQSKFQTVEVVKTKPFGRLLITDGLMQSSEDDEYVYHQSLVHPALAGHPEPKKVFIAGGGEVRFPTVHARRDAFPRSVRSRSPRVHAELRICLSSNRAPPFARC